MLKVYAASSVAMLALLGFFMFQISQLKSELEMKNIMIGEQNAVIAQQDAAIASFQEQTEQFKNQISVQDKLLSDNRKANNELIKNNNQLKQNIRKLKNDNAEIQAYLDNAIPNDILGMLRQAPENEYRALDVDGVPIAPDILNVGSYNPLLCGIHKRGSA